MSTTDGEMASVFIPFLEHIIKAGELISSPKIKRILGDDAVKRLRHRKYPEEKKVQGILDIIEQSKNTDNWTILIEVLKIDCDFIFVPELLLKQYASTVDTQLRSIVSVIKDEDIQTKPLSEAFKSHGLLTEQDIQDISMECYSRGDKAALIVLIDRVVKPHPQSWFKEFLDCMIRAGMKEIARKINLNIKGAQSKWKDVNIDDHWRKVIMELFHGQIVQNVIPSGLLVNLGPVFSLDEKRCIRSLERESSPKSAMERLLSMLDEKDCEGKWQIFKQALIEDDYGWVNEFIEGDFVSYGDTHAWEMLINLFEKTISQNIRSLEILPYLREKGIISDKDSEEVIQMCRNYGESEAVFLLLTYLPKRKPNIWYHEFMNILYENGSENVVKEIDPEKYEKIQAHRSVSSDRMDVDKTVDTAEPDHMNMGYDIQDTQVKYTSATEQNQISSDNLISTQTENRVLQQLLTNFNLDQDDEMTKDNLMAKRKVDESYNKLSETSKTDSSHLELLFDKNVNRDTAMEACQTPENNVNITSSANDAVGNDDLSNSDSDNERKDDLSLRGYQMELAKPALDSKNCIIVAPTGSGKTYVALKIIQDHFEKTTQKIPKVVILVEKSAQAKQQADKCNVYLSKYRVKLITEEKQTDTQKLMSLDSWLKRTDILIVSAQLLVNSLKNNEIKIEDFTLMFFYECHHTDASHAYAQIMHNYIDLKLDGGVKRHKLPVVVGLTASVSMGRDFSGETAIKKIQKMMANLDAKVLSTVNKCLQELSEHVIVAEQETISTGQRKKNYFGETLVAMMERIESFMVESLYASFMSDNCSILRGPKKKGSDQYTQWISKLYRETAKIFNSETRRYFTTCRLYLDVYNKVLIIYEDARVEDAIQYLYHNLTFINEGLKLDGTDEKMLKIYQKGKQVLAACVGNVNHINPKLEALKDIILKLYKEKPDSRVIIFIKTRELVQAIENWMKDTDGLSCLNPVKFIGTQVSVKKGGMTKMKQNEILEQFRTGEHKIILATSVAEEGLDIETCNLIIRYDHSTNEIDMIKAKGRRNDEGSKTLEVASEKRGTTDRQEINLMMVMRMKEAIQTVQQNYCQNNQQFLEDIEKIQRSDNRKRDLEHLSRDRVTAEFVLRCGTCCSYICISSDIKKIQDAHHAVINDDVRNCIITVKSEGKRFDAFTSCGVGKVKCKNCGKELGNVTIHKGAEFPVLMIENFLVADSAGKTNVFKRWKNVPFCPDPMLDEDLESRLQGQSYV